MVPACQTMVVALEFCTVLIIFTLLHSYYYHHYINTQSFLQAGCPSCHPTNTVKALKVIKLITCW